MLQRNQHEVFGAPGTPTPAGEHGAIIAKGHDFCLGAAQINAEFHANSLGQGKAAPQA